QGLGMGDHLERAVREHREEGRRILEHPRVNVDPDAEHATLAIRHQVLARAGDGGDDVVAAAALWIAWHALDRAEQHQLVAGEARAHLHAMVRERGVDAFGGGWRCDAERAESSGQGRETENHRAYAMVRLE